MTVSPGTVERRPVIYPEAKTHKGAMPSPVVGMPMSDWLSHARTLEHELESILQRDNLTQPQRVKYGELLLKVRSYLVQQLDRLNAPAPKDPSKA